MPVMPSFAKSAECEGREPIPHCPANINRQGID
jgi:hypothetical protein